MTEVMTIQDAAPAVPPPGLSCSYRDTDTAGTAVDRASASTPDEGVRRFSALVEAVLEEIDSSLRDDCEDAHRHGERVASDAAISACKQVALCIADSLALSTELNWAAFGESTGGVSLVLQSTFTRRRVDFSISSSGGEASVVSIDEDLNATSVPLVTVDRKTIRERVAWVQGRQ